MDVWVKRWHLLKETITAHMKNAPPTLRVLPNFERECYLGVIEVMDHLAGLDSDELDADAKHLTDYAKIHGS